MKERKAAQARAVAIQLAAAQAAAAQVAAAHGTAAQGDAAQGTTTNTTDSEPVGLCDLPGIDPPGTKRKKGKRIKIFEEWIEKEPPVDRKSVV